MADGLYTDADIKKLIETQVQSIATIATVVNDIKNIVESQSQISANVSVATTNIAVSTTNISWIIKTYGEQCTTIDALEKELSNLKAELWKYIGIGIGVSAAISAFIALLPTIIRAFGS